MGHAMYFDTARAKVVLFGGTSSDTLNIADTWEYDAAAASWVQRTTQGAPPGRAGHTLVFDPLTGHGLLATGVTYSQTGVHSPELDDVWELDPGSSAWSKRTLDVAPANYRPGIAYDTSRQALVLRGQEGHPAMWEMSAGRWTAKDMLSGMNADYAQAFAGFSPASGQVAGANYEEMSRTASLLYDPGRGRVLLVQGSLSSQPVSVWEWDGSQWRKRTCSGAPAGLSGAAVAFDAAREKIVVVGGGFGTWEVDSSSCTWTRATPATQPPDRQSASMVWDSNRGVAVLFGGVTTGSSSFGDTWEWNGVAGTWTARPTSTGPAPRALAGMAYDPIRSRVVLFGGLSGNIQTGTVFGDVWEYDGVAGNWAQITSSIASPSRRLQPSMTFDPSRGKTVLFGGTTTPLAIPPTSAPSFADLWEWDGAQWSRRTLGASPNARSGASGGWIPARNMAVLFGGVHGDGERAFLDDTWIWRGGEWITASGALADTAPGSWAVGATGAVSPPGRAGHAFAVGLEDGQPSMNYGLLFGGEGDAGLLNDTWLWDDQGLAWTEQGGQAPSARTGHALAAMPGIGFLMFGGTDSTGATLDDAWMWNVQYGGWQLQPQFGLPPPRTEHAMAADVGRNKVILFGGRSPQGALADTWEYDIATGAWTQRTPPFAPSARFGHTMFFDSSRGTIVLVGGTGTAQVSDDGDAWEWNGFAGTWSKLFVSAGFQPRSGAVGFFDPVAGESMVFGGLTYGATGADVGSFGDTSFLVRANEKPVNGVPCSANGDCASNFCVDGICCDSGCAGQCQACDISTSRGTCAPVTGAPHGSRSACSGSGTCAAFTCNGSDSLACHGSVAPAGTTCGSGSCSNGVETPAPTCDGHGNCQPSGAPVACSPYQCVSSVCGTSCTQDFNCGPGSSCNTSTGTCYQIAQVGTFTYSPSTVSVGNTVTLSATASSGSGVTFHFITMAPSALGFVQCAPQSPTPTCSFPATEAGTYTAIVLVQSAGEPASQEQSATLSIPVTP
jgi:hypothetical protein